MAGLEKTLQAAHEVAREILRAAQKSMKRDYDLYMRIRKYKVGDFGLLAPQCEKNPYG